MSGVIQKMLDRKVLILGAVAVSLLVSTAVAFAVTYKENKEVSSRMAANNELRVFNPVTGVGNNDPEHRFYCKIRHTYYYLFCNTHDLDRYSKGNV